MSVDINVSSRAAGFHLVLSVYVSLSLKAVEPIDCHYMTANFICVLLKKPSLHLGCGQQINTTASFVGELSFNGVSSAGGVGFDINCGVRLLRTNLDEGDVQPVKEQLAQSLFDHIPVGVGSKGVIPMGAK